MKLFLSIKSDNPQAEIELFDNLKLIYRYSWPADRQLAETLHQKIIEILNTNKLALNNLNGLVVYKGPGSFTGLRIGISTANALADALGIPIVGISGSDWQARGLKSLMGGEDHKIVLPFYGGLPKTT